MKIIEDEVIGELRYLTVKFDTIELMAGGVGVISQGTVRRYFEKKNPDLKVKKCGGLKLDYQEETVAMRFGVVKESVTIEPIVEKVKLLGPGYDELAAQVEGLKMQLELGATVYEELKKKYDALKQAKEELHDGYDRVVEGAHKDDKEFAELKAKFNALITAVSKDAQKFSDLLVENEELKKQNVALAECAGIDISSEAPDVQIGIKETNLSPADREAIRIGEDALQIPPITEDAVDLGPESEPELADGKPDCNPDDCKDCESHACDIELTGADGAKIEGEKAEGGVRGDRHKEIVVADIPLSEESENV